MATRPEGPIQLLSKAYFRKNEMPMTPDEILQVVWARGLRARHDWSREWRGADVFLRFDLRTTGRNYRRCRRRRYDTGRLTRLYGSRLRWGRWSRMRRHGCTKRCELFVQCGDALLQRIQAPHRVLQTD